MSSVRVSIRYKMLLAISCVVLLAMGAYLYLAASLFTQDKLAYIYDLSASLVGSLTEQTRASLGVLIKEVNVFAQQGDAEDLFVREPDLLRVQTFGRQADTWVLANQYVHHEALALAQLRGGDLLRLYENRPLPLSALGASSGFVHVQNSSVAPSAAVLTLAYRVGENTIVAVDFRHERLLRIFARSKLYETYLVDGQGEVLAHPSAARVLAHQDMSQNPLVEAALGAAVAAGVKEFQGEGGAVQIGGFGKVGLGHMAVLTQIAKSEALRAGHELFVRSAMFAVAILLAAFMASVIFSRLLTAPIRTLREAAEAIGQGRFAGVVQVNSHDEIGDLARTVERMAAEIKQTHAQLLQSEKMAAFGQLGAGITHEVKNPLTSIIGFTQLAQRTLHDPIRAAELLQWVEKEALRCQGILVNFLKFARSSDGATAPLQLNDVAHEAVRVVRHQLNVSGVQISMDLMPDLPAVLGNGAELQQVLLNLLINAQQAMLQGGHVRVKTFQAAGQVSLEVADDGPGIPAALHGKIFEPFFSTKAAGEGTGLGLSVSFSIIQAHHGTIDVTSNQGTTFTVRLPQIP